MFEAQTKFAQPQGRVCVRMPKRAFQGWEHSDDLPTVRCGRLRCRSCVARLQHFSRLLYTWRLVSISRGKSSEPRRLRSGCTHTHTHGTSTRRFFRGVYARRSLQASCGRPDPWASASACGFIWRGGFLFGLVGLERTVECHHFGGLHWLVVFLKATGRPHVLGVEILKWVSHPHPQNWDCLRGTVCAVGLESVLGQARASLAKRQNAGRAASGLRAQVLGELNQMHPRRGWHWYV